MQYLHKLPSWTTYVRIPPTTRPCFTKYSVIKLLINWRRFHTTAIVIVEWLMVASQQSTPSTLSVSWQAIVHNTSHASSFHISIKHKILCIFYPYMGCKFYIIERVWGGECCDCDAKVVRAFVFNKKDRSPACLTLKISKSQLIWRSRGRIYKFSCSAITGSVFPRRTFPSNDRLPSWNIEPVRTERPYCTPTSITVAMRRFPPVWVRSWASVRILLFWRWNDTISLKVITKDTCFFDSGG